ncbi:hypothetical protein K438DRAFT_1017602 [Mycena galopus ATCC 62051]|nr:hypothetical protein K438DRAFT_1017602 [Mycena galopus ATCC 62051]
MVNLLNGSPHLAVYVEDLTIRLHSRPSAGRRRRLARVPPKFSRVLRFFIRGDGIRWDDMQPGLQSVLSAFLLRPSLVTLHLIYIRDMPLGIITMVSQTVRVLSIQKVSIKKEDEMPANGAFCPPSLLSHLILSWPYYSPPIFCDLT